MCVHNAGRSQMAAGWMRHLAGDRIIVYSGGSEPTDQINPAAIAAMADVGIDIASEFPKPWTDEIVRASDVVVTMGCGDACPLFPGKRYEDWQLDDPAGQDVAAVIADPRRHPRSGGAADGIARDHGGACRRLTGLSITSAVEPREACSRPPVRRPHENDARRRGLWVRYQAVPARLDSLRVIPA